MSLALDVIEKNYSKLAKCGGDKNKEEFTSLVLRSIPFFTHNIIVSTHRFYPDKYSISYKNNTSIRLFVNRTKNVLFFIECLGKLCYIGFREQSSTGVLTYIS